MNDERRSIVHNTTQENHTPIMITVTHSHHPLFGQQFEFLRLHRGKNQRVEIILPTGDTERLPIDYTDYSLLQSAPNFIDTQIDNVNLLDLNGLLQVVKVVNAIKER